MTARAFTGPMGTIARGLVDGYVPIEPDDIAGGREAVRRAIAFTAEHITKGGHPFRGQG